MNEGIGHENKQRIIKNYEFLLDNLKLSEVIDPFITEGYFEIGIENDIKAEADPPTERNQNKVFIKKLLEKSPSAYDVFCNRLAEKGFYHIIDALEKVKVQPRKIAASAPRRDRLQDLSPKMQDMCLNDKNTLKFNTTIGKDMEILGKVMGFSQAEIDHIRMEANYSTATQMHKLFTKWRYRYGSKATVGLMTEVLQDAEVAGAAVDWDIYENAIQSLEKQMSA